MMQQAKQKPGFSKGYDAASAAETRFLLGMLRPYPCSETGFLNQVSAMMQQAKQKPGFSAAVPVPSDKLPCDKLPCDK